MRVATWNVNSLRVRLPQLIRWLNESQTDVVCLQEIKMVDKQFPAKELADAGWPHLAWMGQPTYNGVAIVSRFPLEDVQKGFEDGEEVDAQKRVIAATVHGVRIIGTYVPNGHRVGSDKFAYKLRWLDRFKRLIDRLDPKTDVLWCGDMNIAPDDVDVWDPFEWEGKVLCHPEERRRLQSIVNWGFVESFRERNPFASQFSWWDYRAMGFQRNHGVRIDHVYLTDSLNKRCSNVAIWRDVRGWEQPSDHVPVSVDLD